MPKKKPAKIPGVESLLVELLTEELPPKALQRLAERFLDALFGSLRLPFPHNYELHSFATPRRLAVLIQGVPARKPDVHTSKSGPLVSAGVEAARGFAKKCGVAVEALEKTSTPDGDKWLARYTTTGDVLDDVVAQKVEEALKVLPIPKLMRWGSGNAQFVRPVHGVVMLHGNRVLPGKVLEVESGNATLAHRFLCNGPVIIASADSYEATLKSKGRVIVDFGKRRELIRAELEKKATGAKIIWNESLLDEVTGLVEWPAVYSGTFDEKFLEVPHECLVLSMQQHQRYFPLADTNGKLLPRFLIVGNMQVDDPATIVRGNERVLRARLSDAKFFYDQDRKERLETRVPRLAHVVYHNKLGSQLERVERIQLLAGRIARDTGADPVLAERAAWLSKADLLTGMVGEFPELQGVMGRYYALHDGEPKEVADAIQQHYYPRFSGDTLPSDPIGPCVALADKLDTLIGIFSIGLLPTGDKDPFALRRHALGVLRILIEGNLDASLEELIRYAERPFRGLDGESYIALIEFIFERLANMLREQGHTAQQVDAVLSPILLRHLERRQGLPPLREVPKRLAAVRAFSALPESAPLATANKRVANILKQAGVKGESFAETSVEYFKETAEHVLFDALRKVSGQANPLFEKGDYTGYLKSFAVLKSPVDAFFDSVMVMVDEPAVRHNRLALLADLRREMNRVADISKLAVEK